MSDGRQVPVGALGRVLVVGTSRRADAAAAALEGAFADGALVTARTSAAATALEGPDREDVRCVVVDPGSVSGSEDDGLTGVVATLRERFDAPVVAVVDHETVERALEAGATDVVRADDPAAAIVARVRNALELERTRLASGAEASEAADAERYRSLLEHASGAVLVLGPAGELRYAGPGLERATGYTPAELEREWDGLGTLVHPDDRDAAAGAVADAAAGSLGDAERVRLRVSGPDGSWRVASVTATNRLSDPAVEGVVVSVEGPTLESSATATPGPFERALEGVDAAVFALGSEWDVLAANERARRLLGSDGGERDRPGVRGTVVWDLLPESVGGRVYERAREAVSRGEPVTVVVDDPSGDGSLDVRIDPVADEVEGTTAETIVYARERPPDETADAALDRSRLFEATLDALEDGVLVLEAGRIVHANETAVRLTGADALVGLELADVVGDSLAAAIESRTGSPAVRWTEPIEGTLERPGERMPVTVDVAPVAAPGTEADRFVCVVRDDADRRDATRSLSALEGVVGRLGDADARLDVWETAASGIADCLEAPVVACFRAGDGDLEPVAVAGPPDGRVADLPTIARDDPAASALSDALGADEAIETADLPPGLFGGLEGRIDRAIVAPAGDRALLVAGATGPDPVPRHHRAVAGAAAAAAAIAVARLEREATGRDRDLELERTRARLDRLEALVAARRAIDGRVGGVTDREGIERIVVEELAALEWVAFAWIGEASAGTDDVRPRVGAGGHRAYLDALASGGASEPDADDPTVRAVTAVEPVVEAVLDAPRGADWRRAALDRDLGSVVSVPLVDDEFVYGALSIYVERPVPVDDGVTAILSGLGEAVARTITACEVRRALGADTVTELELAVRDVDDPLVALARALGERVDVEAVVPRSDGRTTVFVALADEGAGNVLEAVDGDSAGADVTAGSDAESGTAPGIDGLASIDRPTGAGTRFECVVDGDSLAPTVVAHGGVLRAVDPGDADPDPEASARGRPTVAVDLPTTVAVRSFVRTLRRKGVDVDLVARRERDRVDRTRRTFRSRLSDRLTDQQRRALEAAYYGGFFEWPRERTGEEVAETLGVSQPTFNRHFRTAERKLFGLLFDDGDDRDDGDDA